MNRRRRNKGLLSPIKLFAIVAVVLMTVMYFVTRTSGGSDLNGGEKNSDNGNIVSKIYIYGHK